MRAAGLVGLGHYVPERVLTNADLEKAGRDLERVDRRAHRYPRAPHCRARSESGRTSPKTPRAPLFRTPIWKIEQLDLIIVATCTPEFLFPSTAATLQHRLGATCGAFDLGAACSGFVYGVVTASQFVGSGAMRNVLVVGAEVMSRYVNWEDRNTCILFGDGAGAVVVSARR